MSMRVSATPTDAELSALGLLVPGYVGIRLDGGRVLLTMYAPSSSQRVPLVTYAITPAKNPDFAGTLLAEVIEDLGGALVTGLRSLEGTGDEPTFGQITKLVGNASVSTSRRLLAGGELALATEEIHTVEGEDWAL